MESQTTIEPGEKVAVVGFGRSGQSVVKYLATCGAEIMVSDTRHYHELESNEKQGLIDCSAEYEGGVHTDDFLIKASRVVISPGVALEHPALMSVKEQGIPVIGELTLAADQFPAPVIAITGTNGKTTVTELIGELLTAAGYKPFIGGNIGTPIADYLMNPAPFDIVVLELSSFQLEISDFFVPNVAVLLNISPDHLDRHGTLERYAAAKMNIFTGGGAIDLAIMNGDDRLCKDYEHLSNRSSYRYFGLKPEYEASISEAGVCISDATKRDCYDLGGSRLETLSGRQNCAAALLAIQPFKVSENVVKEILHSYQPGAHRLQVITEQDGVTYINDSKATNTGAVGLALEQLGGRVLLIAGGKDKGEDYRLLRQAVARNVKELILIGEAAPRLKQALGDLGPVEIARSLDSAVSYAASIAVPGDFVLLSPACASFDMFKDYLDRGNCFINAVNRLDLSSSRG